MDHKTFTESDKAIPGTKALQSHRNRIFTVAEIRERGKCDVLIDGRGRKSL